MIDKDDELAPFKHTLTQWINPDDLKKREIKFDEEAVIPTVLVCILVDDYVIRRWDGTVIHLGPHILLLRRGGSTVSAMSFVWSGNAGLQDYVWSNPLKESYDLRYLHVLKEIWEETRFPLDRIASLTYLGNVMQKNPEKGKGWQSFDNNVFIAKATKETGFTPDITLCPEHIGKMWVPVDAVCDFEKQLLCYVKNEGVDANLAVVIKDGMAPNMPRVFQLIKEHLQG